MYQSYSVAGIDARRVEIGSDRNSENERERGEHAVDEGWEVGVGRLPLEQPHIRRSYILGKVLGEQEIPPVGVWGLTCDGTLSWS
jgi:hypothetical protein